MNNKLKLLLSSTMFALGLSAFQVHSSQAADTMDISVNLPNGTRYDLVKMVYGNDVAYSSGIFQPYRKDGEIFSTHSHPPQKLRPQAVLTYDTIPIPEKVLKKVIPGQDGRIHIQETTAWPYSIHTHLGIKLGRDTYAGSGAIVGPHHLLTCGHNVYDHDKKSFFEEIWVYPALNGTAAPFHKVKVTTAYMFKSYQDRGKDYEEFDMALLLLDQSIGGYTGWGALLSAADADLTQEMVNITGYPGDKGSGKETGKQMWSMRHNIKTIKPEVFDYEIDTYSGQSGSPIWIDPNKYMSAPMILGVHTLGSNSINSGVRLSAKKFEKIVEVIRDTYALNSNADSLDLVNHLVLASQPATIYVPPIAHGYEAIYERFLKGALIYRPIPGNDIGMIVLRIAEVKDASGRINPLEGTFDLSRCGKTGKHLSISTGYWKENKKENKNKVEIWLTPRFLIRKELKTTAEHFQWIFDKKGGWKSNAEVGIFWNWGSDERLEKFDYLTTQTMNKLGTKDLYEWLKDDAERPLRTLPLISGSAEYTKKRPPLDGLGNFNVSFVN